MLGRGGSMTETEWMMSEAEWLGAAKPDALISSGEADWILALMMVVQSYPKER